MVLSCRTLLFRLCLTILVVAISNVASYADGHTISYTNGGDNSLLGILPASADYDEGSSIKVGGSSKNNILYKEGYTLTGWNDGTTTYAVGGNYTVTDKDVVFTPVFTANEENLGMRNAAVTVNWGLSVNNGAPNVTWQSSNYNYLVAQASVNGETQDFAAKIKNGKYAPSNNGSTTAQVNDGTTFTIPAVKGMTITMTCTSDTPGANVSASDLVASPMSVSGSTLTYTYDGTASELTITIAGNKQYYSMLSVDYPAPEASNLSIVGGYETINLPVGGTFTLTEGTEYTTSGTGEMSFASSDENVATVNATTGAIQALAKGITTITLTQTRDASYLAGSATLMLRVVSAVPDPSITTDLFSSYSVGKSKTKNLSFVVSNATQYTWYTCNAADKSGAVEIAGASSGSYAFSSDVAGTYYVYCVAQNSVGVSVTSTVAAITVGEDSQHTFDFTNWSAATLANLDADETNWNEYENANSSSSENNGRAWYRNTEISSDAVLNANGVDIVETSPLKFKTPSHKLGLAFNLDNATLDDVLNEYHGGKFIWLMGTNTYFVIPHVKAGSSVTLGVETHKYSNSRGVKLTYSNGETSTFVTTGYEERTFTVPSAESLGAEYTDVKVQCESAGSHVYFVDAELDPLNLTTKMLAVNAGNTYALTLDKDYSTQSAGSVTFSTSDPTVCTVNDNGVITAVANGTAIVTVYQTGNGVWAESAKQIAVTVSPVGTVTVSTPTITMIKGSTLAITSGTHYTSDNSAEIASASSSEATVASVTSAGVISALAVGTSTISFTLGADARYAGGTGTITVIVREMPSNVTYQNIPGTIDLGNGEHPVAANGDHSRPENNNTNIGYVTQYTRDLWYVNNTVEGILTMSVDISKYNATEMNVTVTDLATGKVEAQGTIDNVESYSNYSTATLEIGLITEGQKIIEIKPNEYGSSWGYNYKNLSFSVITAPTFSRDLGYLYSTAPGVAANLSVVAGEKVTSYQWYACSDANGNGANAITGATASTYSFRNDTEGDYYVYCVATNVVGSTRSNIANVHVGNSITFDFRNWDADDLTVKTTETTNGKVVRETSDLIHDIYETAYPYPLCGYMGFQGTDIQISNTYGLTNNKNNATRGAAILGLHSGDEVVFTGTALTAEMFNNTTDNGRGTCSVVVNDAATEATVTMTSAGNLAFYLAKNHEQNIYTVTVPIKATPNIISNLAESYVATTGESKTLTIEAEGENLSYQWYSNTKTSNKDGEIIEGATSASYTIESVTKSGVYYCLVRNTATKTCAVSNAEQIIINPVLTFQCDEMEGIASDGTVIGRVPYGTTAVPNKATKQFASGESYVIPDNKTLLKRNYTLAYWTPDEGVTKYYAGQTIYPATDMTLKPVFRENAVSLTNSSAETTVTWQLGKGNDAPTFNNEGGVIVTQIAIDGVTIDLGVELTQNNFNANRNDKWMQLAQAYVPVVKGTVVSLGIYDTSGFTVNNESYTAEDCTGSKGNYTFSYTYAGDEAKEINVTCNRGYVSYIQAVYPPTAILAMQLNPNDVVISTTREKYQTATITLTGNELEAGRYNIQLIDAPSSLTVTPTTFKVRPGGVLSQVFLVKYDQQEVQAEGTATFKVVVGTVEKAIGINYGRTVAYAGTAPDVVSTKQVWDWSASNSDIKPVKESWASFRDIDGTWPSGLSTNYQYLEGSGEYFARNSGKCFQGSSLQFTTSVSGTVCVEFSNTGTGTRPYRYLTINGEIQDQYKSNNTTKVVTDYIHVPAGEVLMQGNFGGDSISFGPQYLRIYKVTFLPDAETPVITLDNDNATFTLSTTDPTDRFYYTLDGTEPNEIEGTLYEPNYDENGKDQGIHLYGNATIKAIAVHNDKNNSNVAEQKTKFATYKINAIAQPKTYGYVEFEPEVSGNAYTTGSVVTLRAVAKPGYGFTAWTTDKAGTTQITTDYTTSVTVAGAAQTLYAQFMQGAKGTVKFDLSGARFLPADNSYEISEQNQAILATGLANYQGLFPDVESTAISIPSDYALFLGLGGNTLMYWQEKGNPSNRFELGTSKFFENEGDKITLVPVFKNNPGSTYYNNTSTDLFDKRTDNVTVKWDFRTGYGGQTMTFAGTDANYDNIKSDGLYNTQGVPYATHVTFDSQRGGVTYKDVTVDVPLLIDAANGSFDNDDIDTWAYMTEGTKLIIPSGYGAVITLATYAPINDVGGTTVNGAMPDNIFDEELKKDASGAYLYRWTVSSTDLTAELKIGNDYAYYQYIKADLPAAEFKYLNVLSSNTGMGNVKIETKGVSTSIGTAFTNGTSVTVSATRNRYYELKYWLDSYGNKIYPDGHYVKADGTTYNENWDGTTPFYPESESSIGYIAVSSTEITFELNDYLTLQAVYGVKKNYYVDFSAGGEAEGLPPYQQHVEYDEQFVMPTHNQHLYLEGYTLDYYVDRKGNRYDFAQSYYVTDDVAVDGGILLSPHFRANTKSLTDVTEATTVTWPMAVNYSLNGSGYPAAEIFYQRASGVVVDQITVAGEKIDLPMHIDGLNGNVYNTADDGFCYFNKKAVLNVPTTKGCIIKSHSTNANFASTTIAGATSKNSYSDNGEVITAKYTASKDPVVTYGGNEATQDIVAAEDLRLTYVSVTYMPMEETPELTAVTVGETPLTAAQLATLKTSFTLSGVNAAADYAHDALENVVATASNGGVVTITQGTPANPVAKMLLQTAGGVTVATYTINFTVTGTEAPSLKSASIAGISTEADGSETVTEVGCSGVIAFTFNHAMKSANTTSAMMVASDGSEGQALKGVSSVSVEAGENIYTLKFTYWKLKPKVTYTLTIPSGTLTDACGNAYANTLKVKFTPQENKNVSKTLFDFVVTHMQTWDSQTQTSGARVQLVEDDVIDNLKALGISYGTIDEATNMANAAGGTKRFYIFVPDGEYCMKGNEAGKFTSGTFADYKWAGGITSGDAKNAGKTVPSIDVTQYQGGFYNGRTSLTRDNISVIGQSQKGTVLYNDPYIYGISYTSTLELRQINDCYFQDMTIDNRFSKYQVDAGNSNPGGQSVAVYDRGIHSVWKNVKMMGYQDTYASSSNRSGSDTTPGYYHSYRYYEDCTVGGTVDFVCGGGDDWWEHPTFIIRKRATGNNLVAPRHAHPYYSKDWAGDDYMFNEQWGYVFNNGVIVAENDAAYAAQNGKFSLGRTWQLSPACTYLNTTMKIKPSDDGWTNMSSNLLCRLHEYGSLNADGTPADLTKRTIRDFSPAAGSDDCILTAEQAAEYTLQNVLGGDNAYDPTIYTEQIHMNEVKPTNTTNTSGQTVLTWQGDNRALCYFIFRLDEETGDTVFYSMSTDAEFKPGDDQANRWFVIRAANERGGLGHASKAVQYKPLESYQVVVKQVGPNPEMGWATVCLPQNVIFNEVEGLTVYAAVAFEGTTLKLKKVQGSDGLYRGRGYVIYAKPGTYTFHGTYGSIKVQGTSTNNDTQDAHQYSVLDGNPEDHAVSVGTLNIYTLDYKPTLSTEVGFYKYVASEIPARKAYLSYETLENAGIHLDAGAKLSFFFDGDDEWLDDDADAIQGVGEDTSDAEGTIYDLSGRRVERSQMRKGMIYVIDGKKVMY